MVVIKNNNCSEYPKDSAGRVMTNKVPLAKDSDTLSKIHSVFTREAKNFESIDYVYVLNRANQLVGVFSVKKLFGFKEDLKIKQIITDQKIISVKALSHQEEAAYLALKNNLKSIPVLDEKDVFLGAILSDKISSVLYKELREDILQMAGIHKSSVFMDNVLEIPLLKSIKHRLPWLFFGLLGGLFAAKIINFFETTLEKNLILASFIPLIVYIADAIGTQLEAFTVRDLAIFRKLDTVKYFFKQLSVIFALSILLGGALTLLTFLMGIDSKLPFVLGLAIIAASLSSVVTGIIIPLFFRKLKIDPANASGPIGTIIQDILSVFIYFIIATLLL